MKWMLAQSDIPLNPGFEKLDELRHVQLNPVTQQQIDFLNHRIILLAILAGIFFVALLVDGLLHELKLKKLDDRISQLEKSKVDGGSA